MLKLANKAEGRIQQNFRRCGPGFESLVRITQDPSVSLIVLARAQSAFERWFHASLERIVPQTTTPLLMLRPTEKIGEAAARGLQTARLP